MKKFKINVKWVVSLLALGITLNLFNRFLNFVESRPGVLLQDPILALLPTQDVTWPIFILIYGALAFTIVYLLKHPKQLLLGIQAYTLLTLFRFLAMYSLPLDPPVGMIILRDPLVEAFGTSRILTKDLFFSGHTSLLTLLSFLMVERRLKVVFFSATACVAGLVLIQHVHYAIDVIAAPFFSYAAYRISTVLLNTNSQLRKM